MQSRRQRLAFLLVALLASAFAVLMWAQRARVGLLDRIDRMTLDAQMQWRNVLTPQAPISLLMIDDASLQGLGGVDRRRLAEAIDKLTQAGAQLVALDVLLVEPGAPGVDEALAQAMARSGRVYIPFALPEEAGPSAPPPRVLLDNTYTRWGGEPALAFVPLKPARVLAPRTEFAAAAAGLGHVTSKRAPDGTMRYDLPGLIYDGEAYPSLALRIAAAAKGLPWREASIDFGGALYLGPETLPLDELSRQWVNYYGRMGRFEQFRLDDLLAGRVPREKLAGRIVIAGAVALGSGDVVPTPFDAALPGVERLATVVDNLISGRVLVRPAWAGGTEFAAMLVLPLIAVGAIGAWPLRRAISALLVLGLLLLLGLQWRFTQHREFISPVFPFVALLLASAGALAVRGGVERSQRMAALLALRASERRYALAAQGANDGLWDWDITSGEVHFSPRWCTLMGLDEAEAVGMEAWTKPLPEPQRVAFEQALQTHLHGRSQQLYHMLEFTQGGQTRWLLARGMATLEDGKPARMAGSLTDVSELHRLQQQLSHDALYDRLTGLGNRSLFRAQLDQLLASAPPKSVGVLLLGMDGMRAFNESHGVIQGDTALIEVAQRLRRIEGVAVQPARIGPDEFAVAAPMRAGETNLVAPLMACLAEPLQVDGQSLKLSACLGLAHASEGLVSTDELIGAAESALARAKQQGPGHWHRFDAAEQLVEQSRRWMIDQIDKALAVNDQFQLHYQPFVRLSDRSLLGFEALIRWIHPTKGLVMPGDFIPVAEASGQIEAIGRWTLFEAVAQLRRWRNIGFVGEIAVNVSGVQLENDLQLLADARAVKEALGPVPAHQLKLEVTESMAMSNPQRSAELLQELAAMGFKISIDDFGTGYSSLAYLHRFPFDTLKIDRSFVMRLAAGREAQEIVRTIVGLAHALSKQTLAEGVEDETQARLLLQSGVQVGQGWLWSKALPAAQAEMVIKTVPWRRAPAPQAQVATAS
ncbi:MAG: EAL domain-containing protein [Paucibacter sp.]|nr:EAL domain-containing protein [Roseateles sp.]